MKETAIALDIDGVVAGSPMPSPLRHVPSSSLAEGPFSGIVLGLVRRRKVTPQTQQELLEISKVNPDIFGNTARPSTPIWVDATRRTLEEGHVLALFKDIYFKEKGMSAKDSKISHVRNLLKIYKQVIVVDDVEDEAFAIAKAFPDRVKVRILQSLKAGGVLFSKDEREIFPNVKRIASLASLTPENLGALG